VSPIIKVCKYLLLLLLVLCLIAAAVALWLRQEFSRAGQPEDAMQPWMQMQARSLAPPAPREPCRQQYPHNKAWFGALHVHTAASYDATSFGSLTTADDAYRFARGETHKLALRGDPRDYRAPAVTISAPLDFMAVTDHAEGLGEVSLCYDTASEAYDALPCRLYRGDVRLPVEERMQSMVRLASLASFGQERSATICGEDGARCRERAVLAWKDNQRAAEAWQDYSADCAFTTFHAYEYSLAEDASNLHRNVVFKNATVPQAALSSKEATTPEQLWYWLEAVCSNSGSGCDAIAIPHNSNWSSGRMWLPYSNLDIPGEERRRLSALRARVEPLAEIYQAKGDSECRNGIASVFGAPDEFCEFEKLRSAREDIADCGEAAGSGGMLLKGCASRYSYVRYALTAGLREGSRLGVNPFKLGIVAATDTHNGTPAAGLENGHMGSHGADRERGNRLLGEVEVPGDVARGSPVRYSPGGIAGVYAHENSRAALFDAMRRRETFGTSGPRIEPRFFAGWQLDPGLCGSPAYLAEAYRDGVAMGGDLPPRPAQAAGGPVFVASASRDPRDGANLLQRIQVVKGWVDAQGRTRQSVYNIAGDPDNGAGVDPATCAVSGPGFNQLCASWRDPEFDPDVAAVYYLRVLENPSCRWSHYDCLALPENERPATCNDPDLPWQIQERAWTSPIWYTPAA